MAIGGAASELQARCAEAAAAVAEARRVKAAARSLLRSTGVTSPRGVSIARDSCTSSHKFNRVPSKVPLMAGERSRQRATIKAKKSVKVGRIFSAARSRIAFCRKATSSVASTSPTPWRPRRCSPSWPDRPPRPRRPSTASSMSPAASSGRPSARAGGRPGSGCTASMSRPRSRPRASHHHPSRGGAEGGGGGRGCP